MRCRFSLLAIIPMLLTAAACGEDAKVLVTWTFTDQANNASMAYECARHGVDSVQIVRGTPVAGSQTEINVDATDVVACAPNAVTLNVPAGTWAFLLKTRGPSGQPVSTDPTRLTGAAFDVVVTAGAEPTPVPFVLVPAPRCQDGVDNDGDGALDAQDPQCATPCTDPAQDRHEDGTCSP